MDNYSLQEFWKRRLPTASFNSDRLVQGWLFERKDNNTFQEAPLSLNLDLSEEVDPLTCPIILVSAPGAVGKSTLARQIAFLTGSVYIDLAKADPVGGNTISGGLARSGLYINWQNEGISLLIDGLDEARLRVTQESFEAFLKDVAELAKGHTTPIVLFGRTGAIQEAWIALHLHGVAPAVLEIGFYNASTSVEFATRVVSSAQPDSSYASAQKESIELLLEGIRKRTESDGDRFAGYAPVLKAVADHVIKEQNPASLLAKIKKGEYPITLRSIVSSIMERERGKLAALGFEDGKLYETLYFESEQLSRLSARIYGTVAPSLPKMSPSDAQMYSSVLETWVVEHPFIDGGNKASSAVFDAVISAHALRAEPTAKLALDRELQRGPAANPFLSEFYFSKELDDSDLFIPPQHIGIVYASLRARLSLGDTASLVIEAPEDSTEEEALRASIEITIARRGAERPRILNFETEQTSPLKLGGYLEDIEINAPYSSVEMGPGPEVSLLAPISIQCEKIIITGSKVFVDNPSNFDGGTVFLEADKFSGDTVNTVPILRGNVTLSCYWSNVETYPWTAFAAPPPTLLNPSLDEALRRFRKFVTAFRSHSKGSLARYKHKIEHARMTKGSGQKVLDAMISRNIITLQGSMYHLDPDKLGLLTGATYADCAARKFSVKTISFVEQCLL